MLNRAAVAIALILLIASPAYAQIVDEITQEDVDAALEERRDASAALEDVTARFESVVVVEMLTREQIVSLSRSVASLEAEIETKRSEVEAIVIARYKAGGFLGTDRVFNTTTFTDLPVQEQYFQLASDKDVALLRAFEVADALLGDQQIVLAGTLRVQEEVVQEVAVLAVQILEQLERADAGYNEIAFAFKEQEEEKLREAEEERLRLEEAERRAAAAAVRRATTTTTVPPTTTTTTTVPPTTTTTTTTAPPTTTTTTTIVTGAPTTTVAPTTTTTTRPPAVPPVVVEGRTCPVNAATSFSDTWGAPRSGGRTHMGVDMMAVRNAPLVAIESGIITRLSNSRLGGLSVHLLGASGSRYFYAHLESFPDGIREGMSVSVGDVVGFNGSSGNAPDWLPHLHFQYAPPGSGWINPYLLTRALC